MDIRIGILNAPRELNFETHASSADVTATVTAALEGKATFLRLTDDKDSVYVIPTASIGYVQIGSEASRRVGFVA